MSLRMSYINELIRPVNGTFPFVWLVRVMIQWFTSRQLYFVKCISLERLCHDTSRRVVWVVKQGLLVLQLGTVFH